MDPVTAVMSAIPLIGGLLKSKKHYNLYYWDNDQAAWIFVLEGHPDEINATQKQYAAAGYETQVVRNKNKTAKTPTEPPASYAAYKKKKTWKTLAIVGAAGLGLYAVWVWIRRRR